MLVALAIVALVSGFINSLAGGGAVFPALLLVGIPAVDANASSTVALFPIQFVSALTSRTVLTDVLLRRRRDIMVLSAISLSGGSIGAMLLLISPAGMFARSVPWLLLTGTSIFAAGLFTSSLTREIRVSPGLCRLLHLLTSIYGGFFGGGIGILVLAVLTIHDMSDIREMNSVKVLLSGLIGLTASVLFALSGHVRWRETLVMMLAASVGGFLGTRFGMSVPRRYVEVLVILVGVALALYFFAAPIKP
jgi:hypothetical protein